MCIFVVNGVHHLGNVCMYILTAVFSPRKVFTEEMFALVCLQLRNLVGTQPETFQAVKDICGRNRM